MLSDNKVIEIFYMADGFCILFNETVKNIGTSKVIFPVPKSVKRNATSYVCHLLPLHGSIPLFNSYQQKIPAISKMRFSWGLVMYFHLYHKSPFAKLQSEHKTCKLSNVVSPPFDHGII